VHPLVLSDEALINLNESLILVRVGRTRSAGDLLEKQALARESSRNTEKALNELYDLTKSIDLSVFSNLKQLGDLLSLSWELKKSSNPFATTQEIDEMIDFGVSNGALGAKLLGAGGAGFVLFLVPCESADKFSQVFKNRKTLKIEIDFEGSKLIYDNRQGG
jgi:D-glycero-alpha-D-manno-heptose-7-phosphate kinase